MNVLIINSCSGCLSTGRIATQIAQEYIDKGNDAVVAYARDYKDVGVPTHRIGSRNDVILHALKARLTDSAGFGSKAVTKAFLEWADEYNPDLVWLHNLHGYYIDCEQLFIWIKKRPFMEVKWTLHDCWAFTGHCSHFTTVKCDRWKTGCHDCPQKREYPSSIIDRCSRNYQKKQKLFSGIEHMTIITPSKWLAELVNQSFLGSYKTEVKYNTIDRNVFKPTRSNIRQELQAEDRIMLLGVASSWGKRKGLEDFLELSKLLDDRYLIVLVGLTEKDIKDVKSSTIAYEYSFLQKGYKKDKLIKNANHNHSKDLSLLRSRIASNVAIAPKVETLYESITGEKANGYKHENAAIICIQKTNNPIQLAQLYTAADVFINPTHEDNYPTVNLEAQACGTPIITYDIGGCRETIGHR